jgi:hypothetical protein
VEETVMRAIVVATLAAGLALGSAAVAHAPRGSAAAVLVGPTVLREGPTIVPLRLSRSLAPPGARAELVIEGLDYDAAPGVLYEVSLQGRDGRRAPLGVINFFNLTAPVKGGGPPAASASSRSFDATEALRRIGGQAAALVFEPSAGVTGPGVRAMIHPGARVRFRSASIRWR